MHAGENTKGLAARMGVGLAIPPETIIAALNLLVALIGTCMRRSGAKDEEALRLFAREYPDAFMLRASTAGYRKGMSREQAMKWGKALWHELFNGHPGDVMLVIKELRETDLRVKARVESNIGG